MKTVRIQPSDKVTVVSIPEWKDVEKDIEQKLRKVIEEKTHFDIKNGGEYGYEVYIDNRYEVFGESTLEEISKKGTDVGTNQYDYLNEHYTYEWEIQEQEFCHYQDFR